MPKQLTTFRFEQDLLGWLKKYAEANGTTKNAIVEELLYALRERRIFTVPRSGPNPFPASGEIEPGQSPEYPILIAAGTPKPGWSVEEAEGVGFFNAKAVQPTTKEPEKP